MLSEALPTAVEGEHDYAVLECSTVDTCGRFIQYPMFNIKHHFLGVAQPGNKNAQTTVFESSSTNNDSNHRDAPLQSVEVAMTKKPLPTLLEKMDEHMNGLAQDGYLHDQTGTGSGYDDCRVGVHWDTEQHIYEDADTYLK